VVVPEILSKPPPDKRETLSGASRDNDIPTGSILLTSVGYILIFDTNGKILVNQTFPHISQLPIKSAAYKTARMAVIGDVAYFGGLEGVVFILKNLPVDLLEQASTGGSNLGDPVGGEVIVSNITLPFSCTTEAFTYTSDVIAACFNNKDSILYFVNIYSTSDKSEFQFTPDSDLSNILPVNDVFYFAQHDQLFRADIARGQKPVERLENCLQPWLTMNKGYYIIIHCMKKSYVYMPPQWSDAPGIRDGAWKNRNVELKPCHGVGRASQSIVFSVDDTTLTFYDTRNNFKKTITLAGSPDTSTLTCTWNDSQLVLMYKNNSTNNWRTHLLTEQYTYTTASVIPFSEGTLPPLVVGNNVISQNVLVFHSTYFLIPSAHQVFLDLHSNISHPMITDDVVIYHAGLYSPIPEAPLVKGEVSNGEASTGIHWSVYVAIGVTTMLIIAGLSIIIYKQKGRLFNSLGRLNLLGW